MMSIISNPMLLNTDMKGSEYNTVFKGPKARVYHFLARDDLSVISHHPSRLGANFDGFDKFQFNAESLEFVQQYGYSFH